MPGIGSFIHDIDVKISEISGGKKTKRFFSDNFEKQNDFAWMVKSLAA